MARTGAKMLSFKTKFWKFKVFFFLEILVFGVIYMFGGQGLQSLYYMSQHNRQLQQDIVALRQAALELEQQLQYWQTDDFYKEQLAREQLQMARPQEQIYYLI